MNKKTLPFVRKIIDDDFHQLHHFYKKVWPQIYIYKFPHRLNWLIKKNPFIPIGFEYPVWIAEIEGEIVGQTAALIVLYKLENKTVLASTSVDTIVDSNYRGFGIGKKLQLENRNSNDMFVSIGSSEANRYIKAKQGSKYGREAYSLFYIYRVDKYPIIDRIKKSKYGTILNFFKLGELVAFILNIRLKSTIKVCNKNTGLVFEKVDTFDSRFDYVWQECKKRYDLSVNRSSRYLNWKYIEVPDLHYEKYLLVDHTCKHVGVLIFRETSKEESSILIVSELYFIQHNDSWYRDAFEFINCRSKNLNLNSINILTAEQDVLNIAIKFGFKQFGTIKPMYYSKYQTEKAFKDMDTLITRGESDLDQKGSVKQPSLKQLIKTMFNISK